MFHFHVGLRLNSLGIPIPALIQIFIRNIHWHFHEYDIFSEIKNPFKQIENNKCITSDGVFFSDVYDVLPY